MAMAHIVASAAEVHEIGTSGGTNGNHSNNSTF